MLCIIILFKIKLIKMYVYKQNDKNRYIYSKFNYNTLLCKGINLG